MGRTNLPLRYLARGAGLDADRYWTDSILEFAERSKVILDGLAHLDEGLGQQQFIVYHDGSQYRVAPFGAVRRFSVVEGKGQWLARGNVVQPEREPVFTPKAFEELDVLLNSKANEAALQDFFEAHPEFLSALGPYATAHPQIVLRRDDGTSLIPDFFLERLDTDFCDILDLKRSSVELVRRQQNRTRFRAAVLEAVAQLETYRTFFEDRENRRAFKERYGLNAYRPRVVVIIGRRRSFEDEIERIQLESQLPAGVQLKTYDDVYEEARRWQDWSSSLMS
jgi:hypothetical protein